MKIRDLLKEKEITLSFEVFPPKTADKYEAVAQATEGIASLKPDFMSVTYGAGGGTSAHTVSLAADLKQNYGVETMCHLTCVASGKAQVRSQLEKMKEAGLENVLALRGDIPAEGSFPDAGHYHYASELIAEIREFGDFSIGGACYPEGHVESANKKEDLLHLKEKVDAGCDFLTTQMFFDNDILYNFLYRVREIGVTVPVLPGIMPVTNAKQMKRICSLSGTYLPARFKAIVDRFGDDPAAMKQAGIAYATEQIIDLLANNVNHIHVYSMNKPEVAGQILENLSAILGR
ncbi:methylenetetrahydrofolate reductase [NAD(P)H] [Cuneatibacter caecimuris]|uniref:Methylenetetrahydrofolate reductase n=1 Tax=Cuneatibacter caecimuris TaxID=1796618 RepID=A0A4Q7PPJ8_9FIRM|nr:methylenetetrahydrofolate reductase [NAD(P)H] [Cuneatibacter caecimuris]RZT01082.1 5,10-methylenetetrahydrofolate reductase (NAD(P)) [Cuneatibacter caecimuris]